MKCPIDGLTMKRQQTAKDGISHPALFVWICSCGASQIKETYNDRAVRTGIKSKAYAANLY